jgi:hypothetical protein
MLKYGLKMGVLTECARDCGLHKCAVFAHMVIRTTILGTLCRTVMIFLARTFFKSRVYKGFFFNFNVVPILKTYNRYESWSFLYQQKYKLNLFPCFFHTFEDK